MNVVSGIARSVAALLGFGSICVFLTVHAQSLPPYSCLHKEYDTQLWMKQYDRHLDSAGIVVQKGAYHPLSIAFYGIMNYEDYVSSHDETCRQHLYDQFHYFADTSHLTLTNNGREAGLPYLFSFKDLQPPWYSGMTQGVAISFMLRYYLLSRDSTALNLAEKFARFMLRKAEDGGTIGKSPEGYSWIEEYPNSKQSPEVLNGFINGLIGLHEYLQFFPNDTLARRIHDEAYEGLLCSLPLYDTNDWSNYNRKTGSLTRQYMRYELAEIAHLIEIYDEPKLVRQMQIWSFFAQGKPDTILKFYRNPHYEFGAKLASESQVGNWTDSLFYAAGFSELQECSIANRRQKAHFPFEWKTAKPLLLTLPSPTNSICFDVDSDAPSTEIQIGAFDQDHRPLNVNVSVNGKTVHLQSCERFLQVSIEAIHSEKKGIATIHNLKVYNPDNGKLPHFVVGKLPQGYTFKMGDLCKFSYEDENICGLTLFYRYARLEKGNMVNTHWDAERYISDPTKVFIVPEDGMYTFMFAFPFLHPRPKFVRFHAEEVR